MRITVDMAKDLLEMIRLSYVVTIHVFELIFILLPLLFVKNSLREKCPNTEFFLFRIFLYSDWKRRFTP